MKTSKAVETLVHMGEREFDATQTWTLVASSREKFWSWGVTKALYGDKYLAFYVTAQRFRGWVIITLGYEDLYQVTLMTSHGRTSYNKQGIFVGDLVDHIDRIIEWTPKYLLPKQKP